MLIVLFDIKGVIVIEWIPQASTVPTEVLHWGLEKEWGRKEQICETTSDGCCIRTRREENYCVRASAIFTRSRSMWLLPVAKTEKYIKWHTFSFDRKEPCKKYQTCWRAWHFKTAALLGKMEIGNGNIFKEINSNL